MSENDPQRRPPWHYRCVPLASNLLTGKSLDGSAAASALETLINQWAADGWEFYRTDEFTVLNQPGCVASLFGGKAAAMSQKIVTFRYPG